MNNALTATDRELLRQIRSGPKHDEFGEEMPNSDCFEDDDVFLAA
jgi:hypothetical protein